MSLARRTNRSGLTESLSILIEQDEVSARAATTM
jgi:hypothetical protein